MPRLQSVRPGESAEMRCHVAGEPFPNVVWLKNDEPLHMNKPAQPSESKDLFNSIVDQMKSDESANAGDQLAAPSEEQMKYEILGNGTSLKIWNINYSDTGDWVASEFSLRTHFNTVSSSQFRSLHVPSVEHRWNR